MIRSVYNYNNYEAKGLIWSGTPSASVYTLTATYLASSVMASPIGVIDADQVTIAGSSNGTSVGGTDVYGIRLYWTTDMSDSPVLTYLPQQAVSAGAVASGIQPYTLNVMEYRFGVDSAAPFAANTANCLITVPVIAPYLYIGLYKQAGAAVGASEIVTLNVVPIVYGSTGQGNAGT